MHLVLVKVFLLSVTRERVPCGTTDSDPVLLGLKSEMEAFLAKGTCGRRKNLKWLTLSESSCRSPHLQVNSKFQFSLLSSEYMIF